MWAGWRYVPPVPSTSRLRQVLFKASPRALVRPSIARMAIVMIKERRFGPRRERRGLRAELLIRKIFALIHLSLDGFAAGPNDELDWISYDDELEQYAHSMHALTDAVIWGRRTYEGMAGYSLTVTGNPESAPSQNQNSRFLEKQTKIAL